MVITPGLISLYTPTLELQKEFRLSSNQSRFWSLYPSPTGKSLLVEYHNPETSFQWIDSNTLQPQHTWDEALGFVSISDGDLAFSKATYVKSTGTIHEVLIRPKDGTERTVCRVISGRGDNCGYPEFVSNDLLALWMPHGLSLARKTGGDPLLNASFRDDEWLGRPLNPSSDGKRFAVTVWAHKGGSALLDIDSHSVLKRIVVYDIPSRHAVYTLDAKQQKIKDVSGVALSPDGSLLAVLTDGVVEVYQLPSDHTETVGLKDETRHQQVLVPTSKPKQ